MRLVELKVLVERARSPVTVKFASIGCDLDDMVVIGFQMHHLLGCLVDDLQVVWCWPSQIQVCWKALTG